MKVNEKEIRLKNGKNIILRSPEPEEAGIVLEHLIRVFQEHYRNFNRNADFFRNMPVEKERELIGTLNKSSNQLMVAAFTEGKIVSVVSLFSGDGDFHRLTAKLGMGVETEYHNLGLGTEILGHALAEAKRGGLHTIELAVRTFNHPAIKLYEKCGFRRVGEMKEVAFIDGQYFDEYIYQKML